MKDPKRNFNIDYLKILSRRLQQVPAWKDLAQSCNEIFGKEVDERRRKLEKIRDSVKYRRGDTLVNIEYHETINRPAIYIETREDANIPEKYIIKNARVINVIKNIAYYQHSDNKDYLELEFTYKDRVTRWLKPIDIPQERDALLKNAYIMGFDFFNNKLSDEDLQRLYEFLQLYWDESGSDDNFMKFIGFIKNARFDLIPLWSYEDDEIKTYEDLANNPDKDVYPVLSDKPRDALTVNEGGKWYLTSHVEIRYDLSQFGDFYTLNLDDLETLFYYFAPIILVLERIVGSLEIETDIAVLSVNDLTSFNHDLVENEYTHPTYFEHFQATRGDIINYDLISLSNEHYLKFGSSIANKTIGYNHKKYDFFNSENSNNIDNMVYSYTATGATYFNTIKYDFFNYNNDQYRKADITSIAALNAIIGVVINYAVLKANL